MVTPLRPARFGAGRQMRSESAVRRIGVADFGGEEELVGRPGGEVDGQGVDDDLGERHDPDGGLGLGRRQVGRTVRAW